MRIKLLFRFNFSYTCVPFSSLFVENFDHDDVDDHDDDDVHDIMTMMMMAIVFYCFQFPILLDSWLQHHQPIACQLLDTGS